MKMISQIYKDAIESEINFHVSAPAWRIFLVVIKW